MSLRITFWEDGGNPGTRTEDDFDELCSFNLKSVKQIPDLVAHMPRRCTMISTEYTGDHRRSGRLTNPTNPRWFKEVWRKGQPLPVAKSKTCPLCGR